MEKLMLNAYFYNEEDKKAKQIRARGFIPSIIYSEGKPGMKFKVKLNELEKLIQKHKKVSRVELNFENGEKKDAIIIEIQRDPVTDKIIHIDFYPVEKGKKVKIHLPIKFVGTPEGTKIGGKFVKYADTVKVLIPVEDIPEYYELDVSHLKIGDCIFVENLTPLKNAKFLDSKRKLICNVASTRVAKEATATGEEAEAAQ